MTSEQELRVLIFMTGRNCADYIGRAVSSIADQRYANTTILYVDDASEDDSYAVAAKHSEQRMQGRYVLRRNPERLGKAYSSSTHLREVSRGFDIVGVVDADDCLVDHGIISAIVDCYKSGKHAVWTNYVTDRNGLGGNGPLLLDRSPRAQRWSTSHFFTFKADLLQNVPAHYFQHPDGSWLDAACDFALAYPILDQTRQYQFIPVRAYQYTETNPRSHHNQSPEAVGLSSPRQIECARTVLKKAPLPRVDVEIRPRLADESVGAERFAPQVAGGPAIWAQAAANFLAMSVPRFLENFSVEELDQVSPLLGLAWLRSLKARVGLRALAIGYGPSTAMLESLTRHLRIPLDIVVPQSCGVQESRAGGTLTVTDWAEYELSDRVCYLPELPPPAEGAAPYGLVLIEGNAWGRDKSATIALAALAPRLDSTSFSVWMLGLSDPELGRCSADLQRDLPELVVQRPFEAVLHIGA